MDVYWELDPGNGLRGGYANLNPHYLGLRKSRTLYAQEISVVIEEDRDGNVVGFEVYA